MDNRMTEEKNRQEILRFADAHLKPYKTHQSPTGTQIIPRLCPFCSGGESHRDEDTFALNLDNGFYVCKRGSCGRRGSMTDLARYFNEETSYSPTQAPKKASNYVLPDVTMFPCTPEIYKYFESRGISKKTVDEYKIQSDADDNIVFPFFENGENVFVKFRKPRKPQPGDKRKEWRCPSTKPVLFGMDMCAFSRPLVITEGQIDAMSLFEAGIQNAVSVPSGCEDFSWVENCWQWLEKFKTIILFGDSDDPGRKMVQTLVKRLDEGRCRVVEEYPDGKEGGVCKDANEILLQYGPFKLIEMVENAKDVPVKGLLELADVVPYDPTSVHRIKTMIPALDAAVGGLTEGGITVFTGKAGDGKSTLTGLLLLNAVQQGNNVCAYSGELPKEKFQEWINLQAAGSDYITLKYDNVREEDIPVLPYTVQQRIMDWYRGHFFLFDNNAIFEHNQADSIIEVFTMAVRRYDCKLFLVDNMMTSLSDTEEETRAQGRFVAALKKFATRYGVHVMIVAHPRKTKVGEQLRKDDVGGNSAIVNLSDSAIVVERPNLRIIKNREGGIQKLIECCYAPDSRRIFQNGIGDLNEFGWDKEGIPFPEKRADSLPQFQVVLGEIEPF